MSTRAGERLQRACADCIYHPAIFCTPYSIAALPCIMQQRVSIGAGFYKLLQLPGGRLVSARARQSSICEQTNANTITHSFNKHNYTNSNAGRIGAGG